MGKPRTYGGFTGFMLVQQLNFVKRLSNWCISLYFLRTFSLCDYPDSGSLVLPFDSWYIILVGGFNPSEK